MLCGIFLDKNLKTITRPGRETLFDLIHSSCSADAFQTHFYSTISSWEIFLPSTNFMIIAGVIWRSYYCTAPFPPLPALLKYYHSLLSITIQQRPSTSRCHTNWEIIIALTAEIRTTYEICVMQLQYFSKNDNGQHIFLMPRKSIICRIRRGSAPDQYWYLGMKSRLS